MSRPAWVHPRIMFGSGDMLTPEFAQQHRVTHVINCAFDQHSPSWFKEQNHGKYLCLEAEDSLKVNILFWYPAFQAAMNDFLRDADCNVVFVHCQAGINRSGFLVLAYVCKKFGYEYETTKSNIILQRPQALQNSFFDEQVRYFVSKVGF